MAAYKFHTPRDFATKFSIIEKNKIAFQKKCKSDEQRIWNIAFKDLREFFVCAGFSVYSPPKNDDGRKLVFFINEYGWGFSIDKEDKGNSCQTIKMTLIYKICYDKVADIGNFVVGFPAPRIFYKYLDTKISSIYTEFMGCFENVKIINKPPLKDIVQEASIKAYPNDTKTLVRQLKLKKIEGL